jgi:uncharacterized membrane protein
VNPRLVAIASLAIVVVAAILFLDPLAFRAAAGAVLVLVVPGYALSATLFPRGALGLLERAAISVGLSAALAIIVGFLLTRVGILLTPITWVVSEAFLSVAFLVVAWWRKGLVLPVRRALGAGPSINELALVGAAAILVATALAVARIGATEQAPSNFTQLWMLPAAAGVVRVGVASEEPQVTSYRLVLKDDNATLASWTLDLSQGQQWTTDVSVAGPDRKLQLDLFRADAPTVVYRHVATTTPTSSGT